jgi:hypothetical protein
MDLSDGVPNTRKCELRGARYCTDNVHSNSAGSGDISNMHQLQMRASRPISSSLRMVVQYPALARSW